MADLLINWAHIAWLGMDQRLLDQLEALGIPFKTILKAGGAAFQPVEIHGHLFQFTPTGDSRLIIAAYCGPIPTI